jgi:hypothetical protein
MHGLTPFLWAPFYQVRRERSTSFFGTKKKGGKKQLSARLGQWEGGIPLVRANLVKYDSFKTHIPTPAFSSEW